MKKELTTLLLYCLLIRQSQATTFDSHESSNIYSENSAEYIYKNYERQELIQVKLLGAVKKSGIYHIPDKTKLTTLLSLAGGISDSANTEKIVIGNDLKKTNKLINLEDIISNKNKDDSIEANDVVFVKNKTPYISSDINHSLTFVSLLLTSILTAVVINEKTKK